MLTQTLFEMYSRLGFTHATDRSTAISGLEGKLMTAFKSRGGYGVFDGFLERSLLWRRPEGGTLRSIDYPLDRSVPSWSWMKYEGGISYISAPFSKIDWTTDYFSPFKEDSDDSDRTHWFTNGDVSPPALKANKVREFSLSMARVDLLSRIRFDEQTKEYRGEELRCIVIGKQKPGFAGEAPLCYVLVVTASPSKMPNEYVRVGAGALSADHIAWSSGVSGEIH